MLSLLLFVALGYSETSPVLAAAESYNQSLRTVNNLSDKMTTLYREIQDLTDHRDRPASPEYAKRVLERQHKVVNLESTAHVYEQETAKLQQARHRLVEAAKSASLINSNYTIKNQHVGNPLVTEANLNAIRAARTGVENMQHFEGRSAAQPVNTPSSDANVFRRTFEVNSKTGLQQVEMKPMQGIRITMPNGGVIVGEIAGLPSTSEAGAQVLVRQTAPWGFLDRGPNAVNEVLLVDLQKVKSFELTNSVANFKTWTEAKRTTSTTQKFEMNPSAAEISAGTRSASYRQQRRSTIRIMELAPRRQTNDGFNYRPSTGPFTR